MEREMLNEDAHDHLPRARCIACGCECTPRRVDYGVEPGHHDWQWECPFCDGPVEEA